MIAEVLALDLDWDLISHLPSLESIQMLRAEQFSVDLIEDPLAKKVFDWQMEHYRMHGRPASASVLEDEFEDITIEEPQTAVGDLIDRFRTRYMRNKGRDLIKTISVVVNEDPLDAAKRMLRAGRELSDLTSKRGEIFGNGDYHRLMSLYDAKASKGMGPSLGYRELNDHFNGIGGVTFLVGPPKSCKSWFCVNAIMSNIIAGKSCYVYSLELPANEYNMRLAHMVADIPYWKYLKNAYMTEEREQLKDALEILDASGVYFIEKPDSGDRGIQRMVEHALNRGADCIFIDQLQYVENRKGTNLGAANNTGDYWEVCNDLRDYSDQVPVFVVHQFNRTVMNAQIMPEPQQAKGSAAVEEVATLALGLWGNKEMRSNNLVQVGTLVSRNFNHEAWTLEIRLQYGCELTMIGVVDDDEG